MKPIRFIMVGGFLGGGKTTTIGRLARTFQQQGLKVGIVTNDQATDLVDTHALRSQGHLVGEVAGACFCCNFNELISTVEGLNTTARPDVVLAEPVGSCTDLVATVIRPLAQLHAGKFDIAPYGVLLKPSHGLRILKPRQRSGFSPKAAYIFRKQLEEADFILINRIDEFGTAQADELSALVEAECPATPQLRVSAKTGEGFDAVLEFLTQRGPFGRRILQLDYDTYAEGEAELGWLNASLSVSAAEPFSLDRLLSDIVGRLKVTLGELRAETAHLKVIGLWQGFFGVANLVSSQSEPELSLASNCQTREASVIVNARVALDPESLEREVRVAVEAACQALAAEASWNLTQSFRPGRPVPTHRMTAMAN
jgi:G3E family GTPase